MIARQGADEKSQLGEWKTELLHNLTKEIAQIHKAHNIVMEGQRKEMESQCDQFQFNIGVLRERIVYLEREKEGSIHGRMRRSVSVQKTPKKTNSASDNGPTDAQVDEQADRRTEEPEKRKTPGAEEVGPSQNQA